MSVKSPEAVERDRVRRNALKREKRASAKAVVRATLPKSDLPAYKIAARRMMPRLPDMSKADLRAMLAQAVQNTR